MSVHLIDLLWGIPSESRVFKQAFVTSLRSDHRVVSQASYQVVTEDIGHPFYVIDVYTAVRIIQVCVGGLTHHSFKHVPFWAWRALLKLPLHHYDSVSMKGHACICCDPYPCQVNCRDCRTDVYDAVCKVAGSATRHEQT